MKYLSHKRVSHLDKEESDPHYKNGHTSIHIMKSPGVFLFVQDHL